MAVITYDSSTTDYDLSTEYYDGFDPSIYKSVKPTLLGTENLKSRLGSDNLKSVITTSNPN